HDAIGPGGRPAWSYKAALPLEWGKCLSDRSAVDADVKAAGPETFAKQELEFVGSADLQFGKGDRYSAVILVIRGITSITPANAAQDRRKDLLFRGITEINARIPVVRNLGSNHSHPVHSVRGEEGIVNLSAQRVTGVIAKADRINEIACQIQ